MAVRTWQRELNTPGDTAGRGLDSDLKGKVYAGCEIEVQGGYALAKIEQLELTIKYKAIHCAGRDLERPLFEGR